MESDFLTHYQWLGSYNAWFNARLFDACDSLDDTERKRDRGAFFGSIHRTLNHLVVTDMVWLLRLRQCATDHGLASPALSDEVLDLPPGHALNQPLLNDWTMLRAKRQQLDSAILAWLGEVPVAFPQWTMRYSNFSGVRRAHPAWQALSHWFNHQTHHRGQVTTLLMQAGVDVGVTDMIALVTPP
jgi:uncharacterized damage-inducible protein DinB